MTTPYDVEAEVAPRVDLSQKVFVDCLHIGALLLAVEADHEEHFQGVLFEGIDNDPAHESQAFEQASKISQEVEQAVVLSLPPYGVLV